MSKIKINIYYILIFFLIFFKYLINYGANNVILYSILLIVSVALFLSFVNKEGINKKEFHRIILFFVLTIIYVFVYKDVNLLISFIFALSYPKGNEKNFLKVFLISSTVLYFATILLSVLGILSNKTMIRITTNGIRNRYALGFTHPNEVFLYFLPIALSLLCIIKKKKKGLIIILITSSILYLLCQSRTGFFSLSFMYILYILDEKQLIKLSRIIPILLLIFSFLFAYYYGNDMNNNLNSLLSGRPYFWNIIVKNSSPFTIFGINKLEDVYLDSFYLSIIYRLGIFGTFIYTYIYYKGIKKIRDKNILIACIIFAIYGFTEGNTIIGSINFTLAILINNIIFEKGDENVN